MMAVLSGVSPSRWGAGATTECDCRPSRTHPAPAVMEGRSRLRGVASRTHAPQVPEANRQERREQSSDTRTLRLSPGLQSARRLAPAWAMADRASSRSVGRFEVGASGTRLRLFDEHAFGGGHNSIRTSKASTLRAGGSRPARPAVVEHRAEPPHGEDLAPPRAPGALELLRGPARLRRPCGPIIVEDRPAVPHDEDVALTRAPDALELLRRPARLRCPGGPVVVEDRPAVPHDEDIAPRCTPDASQPHGGPARLRRPGGPVVVQQQGPLRRMIAAVVLRPFEPVGRSSQGWRTHRAAFDQTAQYASEQDRGQKGRTPDVPCRTGRRLGLQWSLWKRHPGPRGLSRQASLSPNRTERRRHSERALPCSGGPNRKKSESPYDFFVHGTMTSAFAAPVIL